MSGNLDPSTWRLQTPGGIKYRRLKHSGKMTWESVSATEIYIVATADLKAFIRELFPTPSLINGIPVYTYRPMPGTMRITASSVNWDSFEGQLDIDPFNADPSAPVGTYANVCKVTVTYDDSADKPGNGDNPGEGDPADPTTYLEISANATGEFMHVPATGNSAWVNPAGQTESNQTMSIPSNVIVPEIEWSLTWPRIAHDFFETTFINRLRSILGKTNSGSYGLLYNAPVDTLLFVGWSMSEERQFVFSDEVGQAQLVRNPVRVEMKILEKKIEYEDTNGNQQIAGHQHFWRPGVGWQKLVRSLAPTDLVYEQYDYDNLFATV